MQRLGGQVVVVTGGTAGIGLAIARRCVAEGATVVVTGRDKARGEQAEADLGDGALYVEQDVTGEAGWPRLLDGVAERFGRFDVLVNNAGAFDSAPVQDLESITLTHWRATFEVNLDSVVMGCQAAIARMKERGGAIVDLGSTAGIVATPAFPAYGAAKAALAHLTRSVAVHCARRGYPIRCNSVHPSVVDTDLGEQVIGLYGGDRDAALAGYLARVPLGRLGTPDEVAAAVAFLASPDASYVTGEHLVVGGGIGI